ncbi:hypothetical protein [Rhodoferax sp.]
MLAYGENLHRVNRQYVQLAAFDTPGVRAVAPVSWLARWLPWKSRGPGQKIQKDQQGAAL